MKRTRLYTAYLTAEDLDMTCRALAALNEILRLFQRTNPNLEALAAKFSKAKGGV